MFTGLTEGWLADAEVTPTTEDIAKHVESLEALETFTVPMTVSDELVTVLQRLGVL